MRNVSLFLITTVFIRILRHILIWKCPTITTCSYYIDTEGDFWFNYVFLKLKRCNFWHVSKTGYKSSQIDTLQFLGRVLKSKTTFCFDLIKTCPYNWALTKRHVLKFEKIQYLYYKNCTLTVFTVFIFSNFK